MELTNDLKNQLDNHFPPLTVALDLEILTASQSLTNVNNLNKVDLSEESEEEISENEAEESYESDDDLQKTVYFLPSKYPRLRYLYSKIRL